MIILLCHTLLCLYSSSNSFDQTASLDIESLHLLGNCKRMDGEKLSSRKVGLALSKMPLPVTFSISTSGEMF